MVIPLIPIHPLPLIALLNLSLKRNRLLLFSVWCLAYTMIKICLAFVFSLIVITRYHS